MTKEQETKYQELRASGLEYDRTENGTIIMRQWYRCIESSSLLGEVAIGTDGKAYPLLPNEKS
jgi:hypothetical protein